MASSRPDVANEPPPPRETWREITDDIRQFLRTVRREDATQITCAESDIGDGTRTYEFIVECAGDPTQTGEKPEGWDDAFDYLECATYVLRTPDKEKAGKLAQSLPPGLQKVVQPGFAQ